MSRKSRTIATFAVTIQVPEGSNLHKMQQFIRDAITSWGNKETPITDDDFTVTLTRKVTTYASH